MTNIYVFSQNLKIKSLKAYQKLYVERSIILTTQSLFENEIKLLKSIFNNVKFMCFADFLTDADMESFDVKAFKGNTDDHSKYVDDIRKRKNEFIAAKILKNSENFNGFLFSQDNDLGIHDQTWIDNGFVKGHGEYYDSDALITLRFRKKLKKIRMINFIYQKYKNILKKDALVPEYVHVYEENGFKYILIGKTHRIAYRLNVNFIQSDEECQKLNDRKYYTSDKAQYLTAWHEHFKCEIPDNPDYDVRWIQDGYLPANYADFTYHFKPDNVTYDVWDVMGSELFRNKGLPYDMIPFRKKMYLPVPKFVDNLRVILVATSGTGDWTALKNRSDDDLLVKAFADVAREFPDITIIYRCHPDWILPTNVGINSINRVREYFDYLGLSNLVLSSNIPNAINNNNYTLTFPRNSLREDLKKSDLVFGEHSISMVDGGFEGIPFCSVNLSNRRNLFQSMNDLGFPVCNSAEEIKEVIRTYNTPLFQEKYKQAVSNYNEMTDQEL